MTKASLIKGMDFVAYAMNQVLKKGQSSKDPDGHPCVGYMDGDEFVPNKETLDAFSERAHILSEYYAD